MKSFPYFGDYFYSQTERLIVICEWLEKFQYLIERNMFGNTSFWSKQETGIARVAGMHFDKVGFLGSVRDYPHHSNKQIRVASISQANKQLRKLFHHPDTLSIVDAPLIKTKFKTDFASLAPIKNQKKKSACGRKASYYYEKEFKEFFSRHLEWILPNKLQTSGGIS